MRVFMARGKLKGMTAMRGYEHTFYEVDQAKLTDTSNSDRLLDDQVRNALDRRGDHIAVVSYCLLSEPVHKAR